MAAFSQDRPGVVADITGLLFENGCNLEDSSMANIMDEFAILLLFSGNGDGLEGKLAEDCRTMEKEKGITAYIKAVESEEEKNPEPYSRKTITVEGIDQTGIVYKVSRFLADHHINIENLASQRRLSPESGTALYFMNIKVQVPDGITPTSLEEGLSQVGEELHLDITVQ
jgi:glycine cleavage system transcriptional repressor